MISLTNEQSFFLTALSGYVNSTFAPVPEDVNKTAFGNLSDAQQLSSVIFYQTRLPSLQAAFAAASYRSVNRKKLLEKIDKEFKEGHFHTDGQTDNDSPIQYLVFKGPEVARYYPHPNLRTSGDIDLLVHKDDKENAGRILEALGFSCGSKGADHEWCYMKGDSEIELHHRLLYDDEFNEAALTAFTDTVWEHVSSDDGCCCHLEPEFHFVYLLLHLRKHFLWAGVGIRQFLDLTLMAKNGNLDWNKVGEYIKTCGIESFAAVSFALIDRWFDVRIPLTQASLSDDFYCKATDKVLSGSAFGDMSRDNILDNHILNYTDRHGKLRSALLVIFPPYEQVKTKYPGMGKYKILLPILWLRRMIDALSHRTALDGLNFAGKYLTAGDQERTEELKAWGIQMSRGRMSRGRVP